MLDAKEREIQLQFLDEAEDHLQVLESAVMGLSSRPVDSTEINAALRAAHSMKGGGSMMGFPVLGQLAHRMEDSLKVLKVQKATLEIDRTLERLLLSGVDCLRAVVRCDRQQVPISPEWVQGNAQPTFDQLHDRLGDPVEESVESVLSPEDGTEIMPILFETEVDGCLERLEALLDSPDQPCLQEEVLILAQELGGLGAMLQLGPFCQLCASVAYLMQQATETQIDGVGRAAAAAWRRSQSLVLTGQLDLLPTAIQVKGMEVEFDGTQDPMDFLADLSTEPDFLANTAGMMEDAIDDGMGAPPSPSDEFGDLVFDAPMFDDEGDDENDHDHGHDHNQDEQNDERLIFTPHSDAGEEPFDSSIPLPEEWDSPEAILEPSPASQLDPDPRPMSKSGFDLEQALLSDELDFDDWPAPEPTDNFAELLVPTDAAMGASDVSDHPKEHHDERATLITDSMNGVVELQDPLHDPLQDTLQEPRQEERDRQRETAADPALALDPLESDFMAQLDQLLVMVDEPLSSDANWDKEPAPSAPEALPEPEALAEPEPDALPEPDAQPELVVGTGESFPEDPDAAALSLLASFDSDHPPIDELGLEPLNGTEVPWEDDAVVQALDQIEPGDSRSNRPTLAEEPAPEPGPLSAVVEPAPSALVSTDTPQPLAITEPSVTEYQILTSSPTRAMGADDDSQDAFIRVNIRQLNQLNDLFGELTIDRNGLTLYLKRLRVLLKRLTQRVRQLDLANSHLRSVYDQSALVSAEGAIAPAVAPVVPSAASEEEPFDPQAMLREITMGPLGLESQFDALEMDRYSDLHHLFQAVIEGMVQIQEVAEDLDLNLGDSEQSLRNLNKTARRFQRELMHTRMRPLSDIVSRFPRALRDMSLKYNKPVELKLHGGSTLIDRTILDRLSEPLLHILRNAFDHGMEDTATRRQQGKPDTGTIDIQAYHQGNRTVIVISDDGQGIVLDKIRSRAVRMGLDEDLLRTASQEDLLALIFEPGFSTAVQTSDLSGRGVGMDVVRDRLQQMHGDIKISTRAGQGTTFTLSLPLTLSVTRVLLAESNGMILAIPTDAVDEMVVLQPDQIQQQANGQEVFTHDGTTAELIRLGQWLTFNCPRTTPDEMETAPSIKSSSVLVVKRGAQTVGLEVDRSWREQEVTVRQIAGTVPLPDGFSSCTILGDGRVVPLVNVPALLHWIISHQRSEPQALPSGHRLLESLPPQMDAEPEAVTPHPSAELPLLAAASPDSLPVSPADVPYLQDDKAAVGGDRDPLEMLPDLNPEADVPADADGLIGNPLGNLVGDRPDSLMAAPSNAMTFDAMEPDAIASETMASMTPARQAKARGTASTRPSALSQQPRIMIVDDSIAVRRLLAVTLEKASYRVEQAKDGQDALEKLINNEATMDAVICDVEMPRLDGYRLLAKLQANDKLRHLPVMMLTSRSGEKHRKLAMGLGATAYCTKPYDEKALLKQLAKMTGVMAAS